LIDEMATSVTEAMPTVDLTQFADLVRHHQATVCAVAYAMTGDRALAEDIAQDTFLAAWRGHDRLRDPHKLREWLRGIARNLARKARRRHVPMRIAPVRADGADDHDELPDAEPAASDDVARDAVTRDEARLTWAALRRLPGAYREALVLYYWEDQAGKQVADALGISEAAVMQRLSRGRALLRDELDHMVTGTLRRMKPGARLTGAILAVIAASVAGASTASAASAPTGALRRAGWIAPNALWALAIKAVVFVGLGTLGTVCVFGRSGAASSERAPGPAAGAPATAKSSTAPSSGRAAASTAAHPGARAPGAPAPAGGDDDDGLDHAEAYGAYGFHAVGEPDAWMPSNLLNAFAPCLHTDAPVDRRTRFALTVKDGKIAAARAIAIDGAPAADAELDRCLADHAVGFAAAGPDATHTVDLDAKKVTPHKLDPQALNDLEIATGAALGTATPKVTAIAFVSLADGHGFSAKSIIAWRQVLAHHPDDLRLVIKLCPFAPAPQHLAAEAVYAAGAQGALWPMLDQVIANPTKLGIDDLAGEAIALGLDGNRLRADLTQHAYRAAVENDLDQATSLDISAFPTTVVNGKRLRGSLDQASYEAAVQDALNAPPNP
jgi:RNA polymerase sigma factor (sigma-70 family)